MLIADCVTPTLAAARVTLRSVISNVTLPGTFATIELGELRALVAGGANVIRSPSLRRRENRIG